MKKLFFILLFLNMPILSWATDYTTNANISAAYLMTEGSGTTVDNDEGTAANDMLFKGAGEPAWNTTDVNFGDTGSAPNSLDFDGSDDITSTSGDGSDDFTSHAFSATMWIYPDSVNISCYYFLQQNNSNNGNSGALFWSPGATYGGRYAFTGNPQLASPVFIHSDNNRLTASNWQHLAATWDGSLTATNIHLYLNGVEETTYQSATNGSGTASASLGKYILGGRNADTARQFNGKMTDVGIFDDVLTSTEINEIYDFGLAGGAEPPPAAVPSHRIITISLNKE